MVYNFLCKDEKNTQKYLLTFAKNIGVERSPPFFRTVYPNRNHVTTHHVGKIYDPFIKTRYLIMCLLVIFELAMLKCLALLPKAICCAIVKL